MVKKNTGSIQDKYPGMYSKADSADLHTKNKYIAIINLFYEKLFSSSNIIEVAVAAVSALMEFSGSPSVALFEFNPGTKKINLIHSCGFSDKSVEAAKHIEYNNSITGKALHTGKIQIVKSLANHNVIEKHCANALTEDNFISVCSLPLLYGNSPIGAVNLIFRDNFDFESINKSLLVSIAKTIALAIQNARYIEKIEEEYILRKAGEDRYKGVVETQSEFIVRWLPDGFRTFVNKSYCKLIGTEAQDLIGKSVYDQLEKESAQKLSEHVKLLDYKNPVFQFENILINDFGEKFITKWNNQGIFNDNKELIEIQSVGIDLTEIRKTQEELESSRQKFYKLFETSPNLVLITDIFKGKIFEINNSGCEILNYNKSEITGKTLIDVGLITMLKLEKLNKKLVQEGRISGNNIVFRDKNGTKKHGIIHSQFINLKNESYFIHTIVEITKIKEIQAQLIENKEKYRLLIENQRDFILKFDLAGKIYYASPNFMESFGVKESDVINNYFLPPIHPDDLESVEPLLNAALLPPYIVQHEERMKTLSGWRWISWSNKPIINKNGTVSEIISVGRDIDEKKKAELELYQGNERFKNVINSLPDLVIISDYNFTPLFVNDALNKWTGFTKDNLKAEGRKFNYVYPADRQTVLNFVKEFVKSNDSTSEPIDNRFYNSGGEICWHSSIITKIEYLNKPALLYLIRDVTKRKRDQEEINKLALIAKESISGVSITDSQGLVEWVNEGFSRITGYSLEEVRNKDVGVMLQGEGTNPATIQCINNAVKMNKFLKVEILNYRKNGERFWNELSLQPMSPGENNSRYISFINDISERKQNEEKLKFSENKFSKAFRNSPNAIMITDLESSRIIDVNEGYKSIFDYNREESIGKTTFELSLYKNPGQRRQILEELKSKGSVRDYEVEFVKKTGETGVAELSSEIIILNNEPYMITTIRDITASKKHEEEVKQYQSKLRSLTAHLQNVRERERQDIARGIHDELGQILTALKLNIKLLQKEIENDRTKFDSVYAVKELESLSKIVDESVKSSKRIISDLRPELLDKLGLVAAVEQHVSDFCRLAGLQYELKYNRENFDLEDDKAIGIFRTIQEALNNTVKYADAHKVKIELSQSDTRIYVLIQDDGKGFDVNDMEKKNSFGLFGMRERILNFGGEIFLESSADSGTCIEFIIPLT